jgi:hypothetical protein
MIDVGEQRHEPSGRDGDRDRTDVIVDDVGDLVRQHGTQFVAREALDEPGGHRHVAVVERQSGGEGVGGRIVDEVELRTLRQARQRHTPRRAGGEAPEHRSRATGRAFAALSASAGPDR